MSHSASSIPAAAEFWIGPPRVKKWWWIFCQQRSTANGSSPLSNSPYSSTSAATAIGPQVASPQPVMPSSVSTFTNM